MQQGIRLTFKGITQEKRRKIIKVLESMGLQEINSQHDSHNDRHSHELYLDNDIKILDAIDELDFDGFKMEAGIGC